jgi:NAD(P)-dependent dehydrogenase (short-subunit alcohol dehydrogenase family)
VAVGALDEIAVAADLTGRTVLITGGTSGIGRAAARQLAVQGAQVLFVGRDPDRIDATVREIKAATGADRVAGLLADLSSQASIRALSRRVIAQLDRLDVLVNCAGGYFGRRQTTVDGLELTFALNHLAYFQLTNLLLGLLKASPPARIVSVSSGAHAVGRIDFEDLQAQQRYRGQRAYSQSKLANVLFTYELARRLTGSGVTATVLHPGVVRTNFGRADQNRTMKALIGFAKPFMRNPDQGAETVVYLASSPEVEGISGAYFADRKQRGSSTCSYDPDVAARLWAISEDLVGVSS